ncbi:MAG: bile acid:sodium symporter family protein [Sphingomonas sp.]
MQAAIQIVAQASLVLLVLAIGLQSSWSDIAYTWQRPALLVRGFVAVNVIVPLCAVLLCLVLPVDKMTKAGLVIMAVSPLAPFAIGKMMKTGADRAYVVGTYSALMAMSILVVPVTFGLIGILAGRDASVPIAMIGRFVLVFVAAPLVLGVIIATWFEDFGRRAGPVATKIALVCLVPIILLILYRSTGAALALVGDGSLAVIVLTVVAGIAAGHLLGGPDPARRTALAQAAATRHPGVAAMVANRHFNDQQVPLAIILFLLISIVVSALYGKWVTNRPPTKRRHAAAA